MTVGEGGGFHDSGFIQPVDFFGTGPRIPDHGGDSAYVPRNMPAIGDLFDLFDFNRMDRGDRVRALSAR